MARGRLRSKRVELAHSLKGQVENYHRFLLSMQLRRVEDTEQYIEQLDRRIAEKLEPYQSAMALLMQIPEVDWVVAAVLIAEIGTDMSVYHLTAWAGLCPGSHESAGKRRNVSVRMGNMHLRSILVGAARSAARTKGSYLKDKFHRLKARRGAKRAEVAIAHKILVAAYHMLSRGVGYRELGEAYLDQVDQARTATNLKRRLENLGYVVSIHPKEAVPNPVEAAA